MYVCKERALQQDAEHYGAGAQQADWRNCRGSNSITIIITITIIIVIIIMIIKYYKL